MQIHYNLQFAKAVIYSKITSKFDGVPATDSQYLENR
jgi:hypothetical protein